MKEKIVYACFCTDVIHEGHRNILREAKKRGTVVAGVLSDREMVRYNRFPVVSLAERIALLEAEPEVDRVIVQDAIMYDAVISSLKPDFVVHGDNWRGAPMSSIRENVLKNLKKTGGELIEIPYTWNPAVKKSDERMKERLVMPEFRRRRLMDSRGFWRKRPSLSTKAASTSSTRSGFRASATRRRKASLTSNSSICRRASARSMTSWT